VMVYRAKGGMNKSGRGACPRPCLDWTSGGQAPLPDLFTAKLALHMLNVIGIDVGFAGDDGVVHWSVEKVVQVAGQLIFDFNLCRRNRVELQNFFTTKAACFQQQLHRRNRYRVLVCRVEIKITTADEKVFRVWSFEN